MVTEQVTLDNYLHAETRCRIYAAITSRDVENVDRTFSYQANVPSGRCRAMSVTSPCTPLTGRPRKCGAAGCEYQKKSARRMRSVRWCAARTQAAIGRPGADPFSDKEIFFHVGQVNELKHRNEALHVGSCEETMFAR